MSTVAIKNTMVMNNTEKKASLVERFKKYVLDNAEYFAVASAVMSGNGYAKRTDHERCKTCCIC